MKAKIEMTKQELRKLIIDVLREKFNAGFNEDLVIIQVKSKQNYKSEWEDAEFRATYEGEIK